MSPIMLSRHLRHPDSSKSTNFGTSVRSPGQWFRTSANQSVPNLANSQHPNRARGFVSIRGLARSTNREISPDDKLVVQQPPPSHLLRSSSSLYGTLRDQCTPPELTPSSPPIPGRFPSQSSSVNSYTPDQSGVSNDSSHPTTPSPAKHRAFRHLETSPDSQSKSMGQKSSSILKKPLPLKGKRSSATVKDETKEDRKENGDRATHRSGSPESSTATPMPFSGKQPPVRNAIAIPNVPRRRSSLTAIHLNSSHFDSVDPNYTQLQHRASTLTEPRQRRTSALSDTLHPVVSTIAGTPVTQIHVPNTLSPPLLSPALSISPPNSSAGNSRHSVRNQQLYLPKTFPSGPIPVPAPRLTICHYECYQQHRRVFASGNVHCRVPCMACEEIEEPRYWKCVWCGLRVCATCMREFDRQGRDLKKLLAWIEAKKEGQKEDNGGKKSHNRRSSCGGASLGNGEAEVINDDKGHGMQQSGKDAQVETELTIRKTGDAA